MKKKNKLYILIIAVIILCFIFIDLIFNFSSLLIENYDNYNNNQISQLQDLSLSYSNYGSRKNSNSIKLVDVNSIISVIDGKHYNVVVEYTNNKEAIIKIGPISKTGFLTLDDTKTKLEIKAKNNSDFQKWKLLKIDTLNDYYRAIGNNRSSNSNPKPPFYIIVSSVDDKISCQYDYNKIRASPLSNYTSQIWDVSDKLVNESIDSEGISHREFIDSNKLNINLNIKDPELKKLFSNLSIDDGESYNNDSTNSNENWESCKFRSKESIEQSCTGCDVDKLRIQK